MEVYAVVEAAQEVHVTLVIMVTVPLPQQTGVSHIAGSVVHPYKQVSTYYVQTKSVVLTSPDNLARTCRVHLASSRQIVSSD